MLLLLLLLVGMSSERERAGWFAFQTPQVGTRQYRAQDTIPLPSESEPAVTTQSVERDIQYNIYPEKKYIKRKMTKVTAKGKASVGNVTAIDKPNLSGSITFNSNLDKGIKFKVRK